MFNGIKKLQPMSWLLLLAALLGILVIPGLAQGEISFSALEVDIWPEYDRPSVLVINRITLAADVSLPVDLTIRIPAAAGEPNAVAVRQPDGALFSVAYNRQVSGEWALLTFTATLPEIQVEYYDPSLVKQGDARQFEYTWPGDYAVDSMAVQLQQPLGASSLNTSPGLGNGVPGGDGLVYYTAQVGSLPAGQTFDISINYQKSSDTLSAESLSVQPSAPLADSNSGLRSQLAAALPWGLGVLGVILIVGGGWWYWQSGRNQSQKTTTTTRRGRRAATPRPEPAAQAGEHIYCHQCGKRASPTDRFCRTCGTKLRQE